MANHTSPIDVIILASDGCYAMVIPPLPNRKRSHLVVTFKRMMSVNRCMCCAGWADSWGLDGGCSEIHGQSLSTHLVRAL